MAKDRPWPLDAEREFWADTCTPGRHEHSLWWFVKIAIGWHQRCVEPGQLNWLTERVHQPWLDWVQERVRLWKLDREGNAPQRHQIIIAVPRGFGKSNILTKALPLWLHLVEPNITAYVGSETHPKAKAFLKPMKNVMAGLDPYSWFSWLYGNFYSAERDWNNEEVVSGFRNSMGITEPTIGTFGVDTGITSKHPILCIYDDPISEEKLKEGGAWMLAALDSMDSIYPALRPDSLFILIGTRYRDDDPIGTALSIEGVGDWFGHPPLEKYPAGVYHVYFLQARDRANTTNYPKGEPVLPEAGWNNEALERSEKKNSQAYSAQMMNDPSHGEHMELTGEQIDALLIPRPTKENPIPIAYATIHIDTAFKDDLRRERGDYSAIVVWLHDLRGNGMVYLDYIWQSQSAKTEDFDTKLIEVAHRVHARGIRLRAITDETEQGGKRGVYRQHLEQTLKGAGLRIPEIHQFNRSGTKKTIRIREAAGYWVENFVRIFNDCPNYEVMKYQMTRIGRTKFDDVSDAGADVFRPEIWTGRRGSDMDAPPPVPVQPGDDILKDEIGRAVFPERYEVDLFEDFPSEESPAYGFSYEDNYRSRGPW